MKNIQHVLALILFGAGALASALKRVDVGAACISAGLFVLEW